MSCRARARESARVSSTGSDASREMNCAAPSTARRISWPPALLTACRALNLPMPAGIVPDRGTMFAARAVCGSLLQRRSHMRRDHRWILLHDKRDRPLQTMRTRQQHLETAAHRIGGNPRLVRRREVAASRFDGRYDALAPDRGESLRIEDGDRHQMILSREWVN